MSDKRKTFSFIDSENQAGQVVKVMANDHGDANYKMFENGICDSTDWTNTGVKTWCWEGME